VPSKRVLVILKSFLGDAVMVTPLLQGLTGQPETEVHVLTNKGVFSLLEDTFPKMRFHDSGQMKSLTEMMRKAKTIRELHFDTAIVVNRSYRAAILAALARIPVRVGHNTDRRGWLLTKSLPYEPYRYEPDSYLDLPKLAGIEIPEVPPILTPSAEAVKVAVDRLGDATVGVQPGARHPWKRIPIPMLSEVVKDLQKDQKVVLLGGAEEKEFGEQLEAALVEKPLNLIGAFSLKESIAAVSRLRLMIGGDTGLMHIAASTGCPTVTLFGPTLASKWGHHYEPHQVLAAPHGKMPEFTADEVLAAARRALSQ
jgi:lipopolysaccharide heptosyltransferase II